MEITRDYPTIEQIKADYQRFISRAGHIVTIEEALPLYKEFEVIEANGDDINKYIADGGTNEGLEWLRYDRCGCLDYIYVMISDGKINSIYFDVWCDEHMIDFIDSTSIEALTEEKYNNAIAEIEKIMNRAYRRI